MLSNYESIQSTKKRADAKLRALRLAKREANNRKRKEDNHRKYVVGSYVIDAFPALSEIVPGTKAENDVRFLALRQFLCTLSSRPDLMQELHRQTAQEAAASSAVQTPQCVCGPEDQSSTATGGVNGQLSL